MTSRLPFFGARRLLVAAAALALVSTAAPAAAPAAPQDALAFKDAGLQAVIDEVGRLTGTTFLYDPARVTGRIALLVPGEVTPAQALALLRSALALHGYALVPRPEGTWIVPEADAAAAVVRVVRLTYVDAEEVALTLGWIAPPGVRIAPFFPTNSVVISGPEAAVDQMVDVIRR